MWEVGVDIKVSVVCGIAMASGGGCLMIMTSGVGVEPYLHLESAFQFSPPVLPPVNIGIKKYTIILKNIF